MNTRWRSAWRTLPYEHIRWIENEDIDLDRLVGTSDMKKIRDLKGRPLLLFINSWSVGMVLDSKRRTGAVGVWALAVSTIKSRKTVRANLFAKDCFHGI